MFKCTANIANEQLRTDNSVPTLNISKIKLQKHSDEEKPYDVFTELTNYYN